MIMNQKELKRRLSYDSVTGEFKWRVAGSGRRRARVAGTQ